MAPTTTLTNLSSQNNDTAEAALMAPPLPMAPPGTLAAPAPRAGSPFPLREAAPARTAPPPAPRVLDRETGGQFTLGQNYPNPHAGETTVPFTLANGGDVRLDLFDLAGRKVAGTIRKGMAPGEQTIRLNLSGLGLAPGEYVYQLQVSNLHGVYRQSKRMTAAQ